MSGDQLEALVLGPTVISSNGLVVAVDRTLERALLVRLALAGGAGVPDERLAADLWGDGQHERPAQLADAEPNDGRIGWLAALPVTAALALAQGDVETARRTVAIADAEFAASGFGWRHFVERLRAVKSGL